jgi:hypothetical protein
MTLTDIKTLKKTVKELKQKTKKLFENYKKKLTEVGKKIDNIDTLKAGDIEHFIKDLDEIFEEHSNKIKEYQKQTKKHNIKLATLVHNRRLTHLVNKNKNRRKKVIHDHKNGDNFEVTEIESSPGKYVLHILDNTKAWPARLPHNEIYRINVDNKIYLINSDTNYRQIKQDFGPTVRTKNYALVGTTGLHIIDPKKKWPDTKPHNVMTLYIGGKINKFNNKSQEYYIPDYGDYENGGNYNENVERIPKNIRNDKDYQFFKNQFSSRTTSFNDDNDDDDDDDDFKLYSDDDDDDDDEDSDDTDDDTQNKQKQKQEQEQEQEPIIQKRQQTPRRIINPQASSSSSSNSNNISKSISSMKSSPSPSSSASVVSTNDRRNRWKSQRDKWVYGGK